MPAPAWEDPADFLRGDEFAVPAQLWRNGALARSFLVIFDEAPMDAQIGEYRHDTSEPTVLSSAANLAGVARGDELRVDGRRFDVMASPEPDGTGWARLRLAPQFGQGAR